MKNTPKIQVFLFLSMLLFLLNNCTKSDDKPTDVPQPTVTDIDGNVYHVVTIGTQVWMVENLKTTRYRNGDPLPYVSSATMWPFTVPGAYANYDNYSGIGDEYGRLYNWQAVTDSRNLAPVGWHVPSDAEWTILTDFLGGEMAAGVKMKSKNGWGQGNGTNESGFTALPGGTTGFDNYYGIYDIGSWWSSTETSVAGNAWTRYLSYDSDQITRYSNSGYFGKSVRCIKD